MADNPQTFLAFDFGTKSIGVAVGQTITKTAKPLTAIQNKDGKPDWRSITALVSEWQPDALIVGMPFNMDGTTQKISQLAQQFAHQLQSRYALPVHTQDERLTSAEARELLFSTGGYQALSKGNVDAFSAKLILESWMRTQ